jgi:DNA-binding CsgD family transcriptional regulator
MGAGNSDLRIVATLTRRERDVVSLLASGCSYSQIGDRLGISVHTVTSHIRSAYRKLDVHSGAGAVMRAIQLRLLPVE